MTRGRMTMAARVRRASMMNMPARILSSVNGSLIRSAKPLFMASKMRRVSPEMWVVRSPRVDLLK